MSMVKPSGVVANVAKEFTVGSCLLECTQFGLGVGLGEGESWISMGRPAHQPPDGLASRSLAGWTPSSL